MATDGDRRYFAGNVGSLSEDAKDKVYDEFTWSDGFAMSTLPTDKPFYAAKVGLLAAMPV